MNDLCVDIGTLSLNRFGEELCGDNVQIVKKEDNSVVIVLADGLGSGVKANILSTLTSKIISTMIAASMSLEECVSTIAATLPVCSKRGIAYSTFTIIRIKNNTEAEIIQYDNPMVILLRNGKSVDYPVTTRILEGKRILESRISLQLDDVFIAMSDGAVYAGVGRKLNFGWQRENIIEYIEANYDYRLSAKTITSLLIDKCAGLYCGEPGDDTTFATVQVRRRKACNLMIGPPADPNDVNRMMSLFFSRQGRHIVCGGTTSNLAADYLNEKIETQIEYIDPEVPPTARINGVDLVTEGVVTVSRVLEYARNYLEDNSCYALWGVRQDGASRIARLLFEEATDICFYVGKAINPAHQNPDLPIHFNIKIQLIDELAACLSKMGKTIHVSYF
jgi:hypothetical protein